MFEHWLLSILGVANQQSLLATYLPSYRHTWFQLGVCTYKQLAMAAYWSGSAMLTASQDRHKLLMNDIHSYSLAVTTRFGWEAFRGRQRSDSALFRSVSKLKHFKGWQRSQSLSPESKKKKKSKIRSLDHIKKHSQLGFPCLFEI